MKIKDIPYQCPKRNINPRNRPGLDEKILGYSHR